MNATTIFWHAAVYFAAGLALLALCVAIAALALFPASRRYVWAWLAWAVLALIDRLIELHTKLDAWAKPSAQKTEARSS